MTDNELQRLITMANQISRNNAVLSNAQACEFIASHLQKFWSRSMKQKLLTHAQQGGEGLDEATKAAALMLTVG